MRSHGHSSARPDWIVENLQKLCRRQKKRPHSNLCLLTDGVQTKRSQTDSKGTRRSVTFQMTRCQSYKTQNFVILLFCDTKYLYVLKVHQFAIIKLQNKLFKFYRVWSKSQFHQHFTSSFIANFHLPKKYKHKLNSFAYHFHIKKLLV